ncbi:MAG TPA: thioredoxin domain-containing protein [Clostridia bacterium]|nr:thioredoxin domain-containing protein [Clostridia bacterium]
MDHADGVDPLQPDGQGDHWPSAPPERVPAGDPMPRRTAHAPVLAGAAVLFLATAILVANGDRAGGPVGASPSPSPEPTFAFEGPSVGIAGAPVTIEIWADYQCPFCGLFAHGVEPALVREYAATGRGLVVFRDFAFLGQESTDAAVAARCAGRQDAFWRYHDLLFAAQAGENRGAFRREALEGLANFAGIEPAPFGACLDDAAVAAAVAAETAEGRALGISSTPTVRVVGPGGSELLTGLIEPDLIVAAINRRAVPQASTSPGASPPARP